MDEDFERELMEMPKPEVTHLAHEELLAKAIAEAKKRTAMSLWWLSIPVYIITAFLMKLYFVPGPTFSSTFVDFFDGSGYTAALILVVIPIALVLVNVASLQKMYKLSNGNIGAIPLKRIAVSFFLILSSILVLLIYFMV